MSDSIKHECGIALVRLLKPQSYYKEKYNDSHYGLGKLYLLMEKQHNRGQEAAGLACVKIDAAPGEEYIFRERHLGTNAITECFDAVNRAIEEDSHAQSRKMPYTGEIYLGHLRYSTTGRSGISYVHPFLRRNNWRCRNLCIAGNFNLTNVEELMEHVVREGQHPRSDADMFIMLEQMGYLLDARHTSLYNEFTGKGYSGKELNDKIEENLKIEQIIEDASRLWDGGFCIIGATGSGDCFVFRDKWGIRPCFYYLDGEIAVVASERAVIQTVMNVEYESVKELQPAEALIIGKEGKVSFHTIAKTGNITPCSFERIYFSRGSDADIYRERKELGRALVPQILDEISYDLDNSVFSFIPNTAEVAYLGMMDGLNEYLDRKKLERILSLDENCSKTARESAVSEILAHKVRSEKLAIKDIKLRTFITESANRNDLAAHVYDITYGSIRPHKDTIVVIDDSIVRGTTLRQSIIKILGRLHPKRIVVVSSSPQIRYPDCYGIDMSRMEEFIAFNAAMKLLEERKMWDIAVETYRKCKRAVTSHQESVNYVKEIYEPFSESEISEKIAEMVTPEGLECQIGIIYQSVENLHKACGRNSGDWYFSGNYPTPGGTRIANMAYVKYFEAANPTLK